jgi:predicted dehydrogenase/acetyltransferase-like isoleucine patch superfamily enzyme
VDAVAISAPAALHAELARRALLAGKHVFVEKPLALKVGQAERLHELATDRGLTLMVGHLLQYHPAFLKLKELVADGALGRLQYLYSNRLNLGKVRREENIMWSFAPHDISMVLALVGEEPNDVTAIGGWYLNESVADVTTMHLAFPGGERAHIYVSWLHPFKEQKLVLVGDAGMAVFDDGEPWESKILVYRHRMDWRAGAPQPVRAEAEPIPVKAGEPLLAECSHFLESVTTGSKPRTDGAEGLRVLRVLQRADDAMRRARTVGQAGGTPPTMPDVKIHESAYVDDGCIIKPGTQVWHFSHVLSGSRIGYDCVLGQNVMVGPDVTVGDGCKIQNNVSLYEGVTLGDGVFCGPSAVFTNVRNPRSEIDRRSEFLPTNVGDGATIGANATIVCGHAVGAYSFIAAGAVVTQDVPPHALMAGVPARRVGWVSHAGEKLGPDLSCPRTGRRYVEVAPDRLAELQA